MEAPKPKQGRRRAVRALGYLLFKDAIYDICVKTDKVVEIPETLPSWLDADSVDMKPATYHRFVTNLLETCGLDWETTILPVFDPSIGFSVPCFTLATDETKEHRKFDQEVLRKVKEHLMTEEEPKWYTRLRE